MNIKTEHNSESANMIQVSEYNNTAVYLHVYVSVVMSLVFYVYIVLIHLHLH